MFSAGWEQKFEVTVLTVRNKKKTVAGNGLKYLLDVLVSDSDAKIRRKHNDCAMYHAIKNASASRTN